jgi:hypothetical protein
MPPLLSNLRGSLMLHNRKFSKKIDDIFKASLFTVLGDNIVGPYMTFHNFKDAWDALEEKIGVSAAATELYIMEQFYDYKIDEGLTHQCLRIVDFGFRKK